MPGIVYLGALLASAFGIGMSVCIVWGFVPQTCPHILFSFILPRLCGWEIENDFIIGKRNVYPIGNNAMSKR